MLSCPICRSRLAIDALVCQCGYDMRTGKLDVRPDPYAVRLRRFSFPIWTLAIAAAVLFLFVRECLAIPEALRFLQNLHRVEVLAKTSNSAEASKGFEELLKENPSSKGARLGLLKILVTGPAVDPKRVKELIGARVLSDYERVDVVELLFQSPDPRLRAEGLRLLRGVRLGSGDFDRLRKVAPKEYQAFFQRTR
jgi:hypothetical protein